MGIDYKDKEYSDNIDQLNTIDDMYAGSKVIKENGIKYLDPFMLESDEKFTERLKRSLYINFFKEAIDNSTNKMFRKDPVFKYKAKYSKIFDKNVDGEGSSIAQFSKKLALKIQKDGYTYVWVDAPNDTSSKNWAPYYKQIDRKSVNNRIYGYDNGYKEIIGYVVAQTIPVPVNEFETKDEEVLLHFTKGNIKIYTKDDELLKNIDLGIDSIPLVKITSGENLPYYDLTTLNRQHYNIFSDMLYNLHITQTPLISFFGISDDLDSDFGNNPLSQDNYTGNKEHRGMHLGANKAFSFGSKLEEGITITEATGSTIETARSILNDLKLEIIKKTNSIVSKQFSTATEAILNDKKSNLLLVDIAMNLEVGLHQASLIMEDFIGDDICFDSTFNKDFEDIKLDSQTVIALNTMIINNTIPLEVFWDAIIKGEIVEDFDKTWGFNQIKAQAKYIGGGLKDESSSASPDEIQKSQ